MDDDLNTADALSVIFELARDINTTLKENPLPKEKSETELTTHGGNYSRRMKAGDTASECVLIANGDEKKEKDYLDELTQVCAVLKQEPEFIKVLQTPSIALEDKQNVLLPLL